MANFAYNVAKGRAVEWFYRVENNDPANSAFILVPLSASGTEAEGQDYDTLTAVLAGTANEQTGGGWVRKTLTSTELAAFPTPDDTNNRYDVSNPQVTWTTPGVGNNLTGMLVCFDYDTTTGTDANTIPVSHHDLVFTADGLNFVLNLGVFARYT